MNLGGSEEITGEPEMVASDIIETVRPAQKEYFTWNGVTVRRTAARRPRVLRLEPSKPRGSVVGDGE